MMRRSESVHRAAGRAAWMVALAVGLAACAEAGPRPLVLGEEECGYCRMTITDARFGAQAVTSTGRVHVFDSVECLAGYVRTAPTGGIRTLWVADAATPGFIEAARAGYLIGSSLRGPMGRAVAFATLDAARAAQLTHGGVVADWSRVLADTSVHGAH
jgi:copper chaperone NosL